MAHAKTRSIWDPQIVRTAVWDSIRKLHPRTMMKNPVMFVVEVGSVLTTGRLLMEKRGRLFLSPDGHGGTLTALSDTGLLAQLQARGIRHLFYFQVDNPLVKIADPVFLGHHLARRAEASSKVVPKLGPEDKLGNIVQVDERIAPDGDADRNLTHLKESLIEHVPLPPGQIHAMPVEQDDLQAAAMSYARLLQKIAGWPAVLDLVHLGMGPDGHTASLLPSDPVLQEWKRWVAAVSHGRPEVRITMTYPVIESSRRVAFLVVGKEKAAIFNAIRAGASWAPAARVKPPGELIWFVDKAALKSPDRR